MNSTSMSTASQLITFAKTNVSSAGGYGNNENGQRTTAQFANGLIATSADSASSGFYNSEYQNTEDNIYLKGGSNMAEAVLSAKPGISIAERMKKNREQ